MAASHSAPSLPVDSAHVEVFHKTLAFFCALIEKGCAFSSVDDFLGSGNAIEQQNIPPLNAEELPMNTRRRKANKCYGQLELRLDDYNQPYIQ